MGDIVVGVDGSEGAAHALKSASELARLKGDRLVVVTAWHVPSAAYGSPGFVPMVSPSLEQQAREAAEAVVADAVETARKDGVVDVDGRVAQGNAAEILVRAGEGADLLVVGSRGLGGFAGLVLGSVSEQVMHHAHVPTLVVRPAKHEG
jgi:nucleotide-binding universal stress UspA family protein